MRYVSKPQEVEAIQWIGHNLDEVCQFVEDNEPDAIVQGGRDGESLLLRAGQDGAQGWVDVPVGHWIVRKPEDLTDHWPVDPDYFAGKYEPAESSS